MKQRRIVTPPLPVATLVTVRDAAAMGVSPAQDEPEGATPPERQQQLATIPPAGADSPTSNGGERDIRRIDPHLIDPNPYAPREIYTAEMLGDMAKSLSQKGQREQIHVIPHPEVAGRFMIADGWTRVLSCRDYNAADQLKAEVHHDLSPEQAGDFGYFQNEERNGHTDFDRAHYYRKMHLSGKSYEQIAAHYDRTKSDVSRFMTFFSLPASVTELIEANAKSFGANHFYLLKQCSEKAGERRAANLAQRFIEQNQTYRWLFSQVQAIVHPDGKLKANASRFQRYANGYLKRTDTKFKLELDVSKDKLERFAVELERLLSDVAIAAPDDSQPGAEPTADAA